MTTGDSRRVVGETRRAAALINFLVEIMLPEVKSISLHSAGPHASGRGRRPGADRLLNPECFHVPIVEHIIETAPMGLVQKSALAHAGIGSWILPRRTGINLIEFATAPRPDAYAGPDVAGALLAVSVFDEQQTPRRVAHDG